jgi:hypothetical protein
MANALPTDLQAQILDQLAGHKSWRLTLTPPARSDATRDTAEFTTSKGAVTGGKVNGQAALACVANAWVSLQGEQAVAKGTARAYALNDAGRAVLKAYKDKAKAKAKANGKAPAKTKAKAAPGKKPAKVG